MISALAQVYLSHVRLAWRRPRFTCALFHFGAGPTTRIFHVLNCTSLAPEPGGGSSVILNTTWYGCSFICSHCVAQVKVNCASTDGAVFWRIAGLGEYVAGEGLMLNTSENASIFTLSKSGSVPNIFSLITVPASTQMSAGTFSSGRRFLQSFTMICMSRVTYPSWIHTPPILRHSLIRKAILYTPAAPGASQMIVPVTELILNVGGPS